MLVTKSEFTSCKLKPKYTECGKAMLKWVEHKEVLTFDILGYLGDMYIFDISD